MIEAATQAVRRAADATGVDFSLLLATAQRESSLDKNARAGASSAAGLFQFVESTWLEMVRRYGPKHGLSANPSDPGQRQSILALRFDPDIAARMAGELTRENAAVLEAKLGRAPDAGELYAAHVLGPEGALKLIQADDAPSAAALLPKAAAANRPIFYDGEGHARSPAQVLATLSLDGAGRPAITTPKPAPAMIQIAGAASGAVDWTEAFTADLWALALRAYRPKED